MIEIAGLPRVSTLGSAFLAFASPGLFLPPSRVPARGGRAGGRRASRYLRACRAFLPLPHRRARAAMGLMPAARAFSGCRSCPRPCCRLPACCAPAAPGRAGLDAGVQGRERSGVEPEAGEAGEGSALSLSAGSWGSVVVPALDPESPWGSGTYWCPGAEAEAGRLLPEWASRVRR